MIIDKNSWHYRFMNYAYKQYYGWSMGKEERPETLCAYFWALIYSFMWVVISHTFIAFLVCSPFILTYAYLINGSQTAGEVLVLIGAVVLFIICSVGFFALLNYIKSSPSLTGT